MSDPMSGNWPELDSSPGASAQMIDWYAPETSGVIRALARTQALLWAADQIEGVAQADTNRVHQRWGDSRREKARRLKRGHGISAALAIAQQLREWADDERGDGGPDAPTDLLARVLRLREFGEEPLTETWAGLEIEIESWLRRDEGSA